MIYLSRLIRVLSIISYSYLVTASYTPLSWRVFAWISLIVVASSAVVLGIDYPLFKSQRAEVR